MSSSSGNAELGFGLSRPVFVRVLPFLVYVVFLGLQSALEQSQTIRESGIDTRWFYALRVAAVSSVLAYYWRDYTELALGKLRHAQSGSGSRVVERLSAVLVGVLVFILWINLDQGWVTLGSSTGGFVALDRDGLRDWPLIAVRLLGASIVVPVMEELFWRSFVQRWIDRPYFLDLEPRQCSLRALLLSSVLFGFEHSQWLAGVIAGLAYGYLYRRTGRLWIPVAAHGVTNFLLGCWVVNTGQWHFW